MKSYRTSRVFHLRFWLDTYGILLALVMGVSGQFIALNPFEILAFGTPLLSPQDWAGSRAIAGPELSPSFTAGRLVENHEFFVLLEIMGTGLPYQRAEIGQRTVWYADPVEAFAAWDRRETSQFDGDFSLAVPDEIRPLDQDHPGSVLYCDEPTEYHYLYCQYFAYWEHWYTEVWFSSDSDQLLSRAEIQALADHIDQLLLKAPDKPLLLLIPWAMDDT